MINTVGTTVGNSHTTVSTPRGYQHFPVKGISIITNTVVVNSNIIMTLIFFNLRKIMNE